MRGASDPTSQKTLIATEITTEKKQKKTKTEKCDGVRSEVSRISRMMTGGNEIQPGVDI